MPEVSIILPTYKDAPRIGAAISSVLSQTFADWELIIVDDGLTDEGKKRINSFSDSRIRIIENEKNMGVQQSLNQGLAVAIGAYIARIDDDDEWIDQKKLLKQIAFLNEHPDCVLLGTDAEIVDENGTALGTYAMPHTDEEIRHRMLLKNCFLHPTIMARREAIARVSGYDNSQMVKHIEDYDLWLKLGRIGSVANLPITAARLTVHPQSMTAQNRVLQARRMLAIIGRYRYDYPRFFTGFFILATRYVGFLAVACIPLPKKVLYMIQRIYKNS